MWTRIDTATGLKRQTMSNWFGDRVEPDLKSLTVLAGFLEVSRADLVAAYDGTDLSARLPEPQVMSDAERKRRRSWWLYVARHTARLGLDDAREQLAAAGFRSERGNLISIWEDPAGRLEPNAAQVRALADIYRIPPREFVELWNNPPATDEDEMAARRGVDIVAVEPPAQPQDQHRRRRAS